jgi:ArsR family transcriptional regulator
MVATKRGVREEMPQPIETPTDKPHESAVAKRFSDRLTAMDSKRIERVSKALADQTRLRIFAAISSKGDLTCSELVTLQGVTPATISHHLKILIDAELIECHKDGQFVHSRVVPATIAEYSASLARMASRGKVARKSVRN